MTEKSLFLDRDEIQEAMVSMESVDSKTNHALPNTAPRYANMYTKGELVPSTNN